MLYDSMPPENDDVKQQLATKILERDESAGLDSWGGERIQSLVV